MGFHDPIHIDNLVLSIPRDFGKSSAFRGVIIYIATDSE